MFRELFTQLGRRPLFPTPLSCSVDMVEERSSVQRLYQVKSKGKLSFYIFPQAEQHSHSNTVGGLRAESRIDCQWWWLEATIMWLEATIMSQGGWVPKVKESRPHLHYQHLHSAIIIIVICEQWDHYHHLYLTQSSSSSEWCAIIIITICLQWDPTPTPSSSSSLMIMHHHIIIIIIITCIKWI